jgi:hypothetical protein
MTRLRGRARTRRDGATWLDDNAEHRHAMVKEIDSHGRLVAKPDPDAPSQRTTKRRRFALEFPSGTRAVAAIALLGWESAGMRDLRRSESELSALAHRVYWRRFRLFACAADTDAMMCLASIESSPTAVNSRRALRSMLLTAYVGTRPMTGERFRKRRGKRTQRKR